MKLSVVHEHPSLHAKHSLALYDLHTLYKCKHAQIVPVRCPVICLSKPLNCCLYLSLEACGTAQSLGPATISDVIEGDEEAELEDKHH